MPQRRSISNMTVRIVTGLTLLPLFMFIAMFGSWLFALMAAGLTAIAIIEFYHMEKGRESQGNVLIGLISSAAILWAFYNLNVAILGITLLLTAVVTFLLELVVRGSTFRQAILRVLTTLGGVVYIAIPAGMLIAIRGIYPYGLNWLFVILFATWGTDSFAYLGGRWFGKTKLAPVLSPSKTVEGAVVGFIAGVFFPCLVLLQIERLTPVFFVVLLILPLAAIAGDLFESGMKRFFGIKDSYVPGLNIFPGHGGVLDRIDSLLWVTPVFFIFLLLQGIISF